MFVDVKLPNIQGDQLIAELCKSEKPPYMIPMSASTPPEETMRRLKDLGCEHFLAKPFDVTHAIELAKSIAVKKGLLG